MSSILDLTPGKETFEYRVLSKQLFHVEVREHDTIPVAFRDSNREEIVRTLRELGEKHHIRDVRVSLPFSWCLYSILDLPVTRKSDVEGALLFELEKNLPLPVSEYVSDYRIVAKNKTSSKVLVLSVKRDFLARIDGAIREAGMALNSVRCGFLETLSLLFRRKDLKDFLLIEIDGGAVNIAVVKDRRCALLKHLADTGILVREAEYLKNTYALDTIMLSGDVTDEVRDALGISGVQTEAEPASRKSPKPFNFEFARNGIGEGREKKIVRFAQLSVAASFLLIMIGFFWPVYRDYAALKKIDREVDVLKAQSAGPLERKKHLEETRDRLKFLDKVQASREVPVRVIAELSALLPKEAWVISTNVDDKGFVEVKGFASNATQLVEILEKSDLFKNAGFSAPVMTTGDKARYSIKMEIER